MARVFISYSHDSEAHKKWVSKLSTFLRSKGLDVLMDESDVASGQDFNRFARVATQTSDRVLLICTPEYARRANHGLHGVGYETTLFKSEANGQTDKFICVLRRGEPEQAIPDYMAHMRNRRYLDCRMRYTKQWERLAHDILEGVAAEKIGDLIYELNVPFDSDRVHDEPTLDALKRFTRLLKHGQHKNGRWFVSRIDPSNDDVATVFFQDPAD